MPLHKHVCQEENSLWNEAIRDAEIQLAKADQAKTKRLRAAIKSFKANRDSGIPWPRFTKELTPSESAEHRTVSALPKRDIANATARIGASADMCQAFAQAAYSVLAYFFKPPEERAGFDLPLLPVKNFADRLHEYLSLPDFQLKATIQHNATRPSWFTSAFNADDLVDAQVRAERNQTALNDLNLILNSSEIPEAMKALIRITSVPYFEQQAREAAENLERLQAALDRQNENQTGKGE